MTQLTKKLILEEIELNKFEGGITSRYLMDKYQTSERATQQALKRLFENDIIARSRFDGNQWIYHFQSTDTILDELKEAQIMEYLKEVVEYSQSLPESISTLHRNFTKKYGGTRTKGSGWGHITRDFLRVAIMKKESEM